MYKGTPVSALLLLTLILTASTSLSAIVPAATALDGAWMTVQLKTVLAKGKATVNVTDPVTGTLITTAIGVDSGKGKCFMNLEQVTDTQFRLRTICVDGANNWRLTSTNNVYDQHDNATLGNDWPEILFVANGKSKGTDDVAFHYEGVFILGYKIKDGSLQSLKLVTKGAEGMAAFNDHSDPSHHIDGTGKAKLKASFVKDDTDTTVLPTDATTCLAVAKGDISSPGSKFDNCVP